MKMMRILLVCLFWVLGGLIALQGANAANASKHIGYYYPQPQTSETYHEPLPQLSGVSRFSRVGFVTQLDQIQKNRPYAPTYHMYLKGGDWCQSGH